MENQYKPKAKEVFGEIYESVADKFSKENLRKKEMATQDSLRHARNIAKDFTREFMASVGVINLGPYMMASTKRVFASDRQPIQNNTSQNTLIPDNNVRTCYVPSASAERYGLSTGVFAGLVLGLGQFIGYNYALKYGHYEVLFIPVATNVASLVYEQGRKVYKRAEQRVVESKTNKCNLEKLLDSTN
ncbi:MAG: hypothetical protein WCI72_00120 [archaeon]